jgi:anti-sigma factor RsiW
VRVSKLLRATALRALGLVGLHPWLTCRRCVDVATEFLEGALPAEERARVLAHLRACPHCPRYFRQIELAVRLARASSGGSPPLGARQALLDAFRQWHRARDEET